MVSHTIPVRLEGDDLGQVDLLVKLGIFNSRSEALRELVRLGVKSLSEVAEVAMALEKLFAFERAEGEIPVKLPGAVKELIAERERFQ